MGKVFFDEKYIKKQKKEILVSNMDSFLIKVGLVKDKRQADHLKIVMVIFLFLYIFWTSFSLFPKKFDGNLNNLPEDVPSFLRTN